MSLLISCRFIFLDILFRFWRVNIAQKNYEMIFLDLNDVDTSFLIYFALPSELLSRYQIIRMVKAYNF